jgi:hypothetical protein
MRRALPLGLLEEPTCGAIEPIAVRTDSCPGPVTIATSVDPASSAARTTCPTMGSPPTACSTFGVAERMRVPSPAARMIDNNSAMNAPF